MARPVESERRNLLPQIMDCAWKSIKAEGAGFLSLRGIARQLGISAPAIYHYFPNYDALVTALVIDAYTSLGKSQIACQVQHQELAIEKQLWHLGVAYRGWAIENPAHYLLIFGSPVPGYQFPKDAAFPPEAFAMVPLMKTMQSLKNQGLLASGIFPNREQDLIDGLTAWGHGAEFDLDVLYASLAVWNQIHGLIMLEITSLLPFSPASSQVFYELELDACLGRHLHRKA